MGREGNKESFCPATSLFFVGSNFLFFKSSIFSTFGPFVSATAILAVVVTSRLINQSKVVQTLQTSAKDKEVAELLATMSNNLNKDSQEYKEAREKFCL